MAITNLSTSSLVSGVKRRRVWDQTATTDGFFQIATTTLNVSAASITFSSIPQGYTHLQVRYTARATVNDNTYMRFNGDTGANYSSHYIYGQGSSAASGGLANGTSFFVDILTGSATSYNAAVVDILDYANTNKYKTARTIAGMDLNGSGNVWLVSGNWRNTAAITSITLNQSSSSYVFEPNSSFALYGIKG
jgi:hypothetical protein